MYNVGIVGNGFVGGAIYHTLKDKDFVDCAVHDVDPNKCMNSFGETIDSEIIFVCVPTPTNLDTGTSDTSYVLSVISGLPFHHPATVVIKSTVLPGTCERIHRVRPDLKIVFSPEFLTERTARYDFAHPARIILGYGAGIDYKSSVVYDFFYKCFPNVYTICTDWKTAEFIKYFCNCFYATKVSLMNEFFQLAHREGVDWNTAVDGLLSSGWVNPMHTKVPGPDGLKGFGGKCFPKDLNAFIGLANKRDINPTVLAAAWEKNLEVRKDKDWEHIKDATTKGKNNV
jgi:nucleotide sugar dehydrogenase